MSIWSFESLFLEGAAPMFAARLLLYAFAAGCALATAALIVMTVQTVDRSGMAPQISAPPLASAAQPSASPPAESVTETNDVVPRNIEPEEGAIKSKSTLQLEKLLVGQWEPEDPGPGWNLYILQFAPAGELSYTCWPDASDRPRFRCTGQWQVSDNACHFSTDHDPSSREWQILARLINAGQKPIVTTQNVNPATWVWTVEKVDEESFQLPNGQRWIRSPFEPPDQDLVDARDKDEQVFERVYSHINSHIGKTAGSREDLRLKVRTLCNLAQMAEMNEREVVELFDEALLDSRRHGIEPQFALDAAIQGASLGAAMRKQP